MFSQDFNGFKNEDIQKIIIFTDGSVHPQSKIGVGAYLIISEDEFDKLNNDLIHDKIQSQKFTSTSSTQLEIETLLFALEEIKKNNFFSSCDLSVYTDSQCIVGLPKRRKRLEQMEFKNAGKNKELNHARLYRQFYQMCDLFRIEFIKVKGHTKTHEQDKFDLIFSYVDKKSRSLLRDLLQRNNS